MTGSQDTFQKAMNQGHSAAWDQLWDKASQYYRQALEEFPDNSQALSSLGLALFETMQYEEALRYYLKAARYAPGDPIPVEKVAQIYERLGNIEYAQKAAFQAAELYIKNREANKAIENWNRVCRLKPENLKAHARLAVIYEHLGATEKSITEYLSVASLYQHSGDTEHAVQAVNRALKVMPGSSRAQEALNLLRDYKSLPMPSRPRGATAPLRMAKVRQLEAPGEEDGVEPGLDPIAETRQKSLTMLAGLLFEIEEVERTDPSRKRGLRSIVSGTGNLHKPKEFDHTKIMLHLSQMIDLQTQGELDQAVEELERAMDAGLDHPAAYFDLGFLHAQSRQSENALRHLQLAMKQPDFALGSRLLLGEILRDMGRSRDAAVEYLEALRIADADVVPENQREDLYQLYEPMIEELRQEESTDAQERVCDNVSDLLMRTDWRENLVHARQQLVSQQNGGPIVPIAEVIIQSRSSQIVDSLTKIYDMAHRGYFRSAMEEAFYALQYAPTYLPLHTYMGELLLQEDQMQDAINKFIAVAQTYSTRGEVRRAIDLYRRVIELAPMDLKPRNRLIELLIDLNHLPEALSEYLDYADVYYSLADLDMARKTYTDALRLAQNSNMDRSWRVKILHRMADIDLQSLDWRQALRIYEQIRTIQPDDVEARSRLVELNFRLGQQLQALSELDNYVTLLIDSERVDAALKFVEELVREDPERPQIRTRLASIYQRMGQTEKAINQLDAAGEQFLDQGDRNNAIRTVETIVNFNPANVAQYQRLLEKLKTD